MDTWGTAITFVLKMEGGYSTDPNDPGGETNFGISKKAYPDLDIKNMTVEQAQDIYKNDFWQACDCDSLPAPFAIALFDTAVNQGTREAIRILQISLGGTANLVAVDGIMGDATITATHKADPKVIKKFLAERMAAYARLMAAKQNLLVYAVNWSFRVISLATLLAGGN